MLNLSIWQKFQQTLSGHVETAEHHRDEELRTRYFKTTKEKMIAFLRDVLTADARAEIVAESTERGEISVNVRAGKTYFVVITVIMVRPFRTAVDFSVTAKKGFDFGFGRRFVLDMYRQMESQFEYVGSGLNGEA